MNKFFKATMFAAAFALAACGGQAQAADTIKGVNQNGVQETVGTKPIFAVKSSGGVLSYRSTIGGGTPYTLSDANNSQYTKALASFGAGNAIAAPGGWFYDLGKISVKCYNPQTTAVSIAGLANADYLPDNCAFAALANSQ